MLDRSLDHLSDAFRPKVFEFLARLVEAGIAVVIVNTLRTPEQQAQNIANGVSWTKNSKHLTGNAIDVAPYAQYLEHGDTKINWDATDPAWQRMGQIGENVGLVWGGRWVTTPDLGHFEQPSS